MTRFETTSQRSDPMSLNDVVGQLLRGGMSPASRTRLEHSTGPNGRSEEHTSELQSLMRNSYAVFCLTKQKSTQMTIYHDTRIKNKQIHTHQHTIDIKAKHQSKHRTHT